MRGSDLDEYGQLYVTATARFVNSTSGYEDTVGSSEGFTTDLTGSFKLWMVVPDVEDECIGTGDTVHFQVRATLEGVPVDLDEGSLLIDEHYSTCTVDHSALGLYECAFTAPDVPWSNESHGLIVSAEGNHTADGWTAHGYDQRLFLLSFFRIWFHRTLVTEQGSEVELCVLDRDGIAVEGANVTLEYSDTQWEAVGDVHGTLYGTTDTLGRVGFTVDYAELDDSLAYVYFLGRVEHGGKTQSLDECIKVRDLPALPVEPPSPTDRLFGFDPLPADTVVTLNATIMTGPVPVPQAKALVYIWGERGLYLDQVVLSDNHGNISVTFRTPVLEPGESYTKISTHFVRWYDDNWGGSSTYVGRVVGTPEDYDFWDGHLDDETELTVSRAGPLGPIRVVLENPSADGSQETAGVAWGFGVLPRERDPAGALWRWTELHCCDWSPRDPLCWVSVVECRWTGTYYEAIIDLPDFIDDLIPMWFYGAIQFVDSPFPDLRGTYLENVTPPFEDDRPPGLTVELPVDGGTYSSEILARGTAWDDHSVPVVQLRIDAGGWQIASGGTAWNMTIDTKGMSYGMHTLEARSFDGFLHSEIVGITFMVDNPPFVSSVDLPGDQWLNGSVLVTGSAHDDGGVVSVEVSIDDGQWSAAEGASTWTYMLGTVQLGFGTHRFSVRAFDRSQQSLALTLPFKVDNPPTIWLTGSWDGTPIMGTVRFAGVAHDDNGVVHVEARLGSGRWEVCSGTAEWSYVLDTRPLGFGPIRITVRAFDGRMYSPELVFTPLVDNPPAVLGMDLLVGQRLEGVAEVRGTASDDRDVTSVEFQVDDGAWGRAMGMAGWVCSIDTGPLSSGSHLLRVRAFDGSHYSDVVERLFTVDLPPRVSITSLEDGGVYNGTLQVAGKALDDNGVRSVEVCIDGGTWQKARGSTVWTFPLDTTTLGRGFHRFSARAFDGGLLSLPVSVQFEVDQPPALEVISPSPRGRYSGELTISGTTMDDGGEPIVEWRLDGGPWHVAYGGFAWSDSVDLDSLSKGTHSLEALCFDGVSRSRPALVQFEVIEGGGGPTVGGSDLPLLALVLLAVVSCVAIIVYMRRRGHWM
jgi:hypothetical protein